jgi:hypothetical protein
LIVDASAAAFFAARFRFGVEAMSAASANTFNLGMHGPLDAC